MLDEASIASQLSKIKDFIPSEYQCPSLEPWLTRLERHAVMVYNEALGYQASLEDAPRRLNKLDMRLNPFFGIQHYKILKARGQFTVCGIISFIENEIFPQHPTYTKLLDETVAEYCMEKG